VARCDLMTGHPSRRRQVGRPWLRYTGAALAVGGVLCLYLQATEADPQDPAGSLCEAICAPASSDVRAMGLECWCGDGGAAELVVH